MRWSRLVLLVGFVVGFVVAADNNAFADIISGSFSLSYIVIYHSINFNNLISLD